MVRRLFFGLAASLLVVTTGIAEDTQTEKVAPGSVAYLDSLAGFRGIKFGTTFSEFTDLTLDQDHGKLKLYTKTNEDLKLGLARLETIVYHFSTTSFTAFPSIRLTRRTRRPWSPSLELALDKEPNSISITPSGKARRPGLSFRKIPAPAKERYSSVIAS